MPLLRYELNISLRTVASRERLRVKCNPRAEQVLG